MTMKSAKQRAWAFDQFSKSGFFHQRLREWGLIEVAELIENISGETLDWDLESLNISETAWNRIIHSGIKPVIVFANPAVLTNIPRSVSYYRMLAMVSQKSMNQIGVSTTRYEKSDKMPRADVALLIAQRLNLLISNLIESDNGVNKREFDIWRGMAAGAQAQGSWQNRKGDQAEYDMRKELVEQLRRSRLISNDLFVNIYSRVLEMTLLDGRVLRMGAEPDIVIYTDDRIQSVVEIKGGIDSAGVLERVGAAIKSLRRAKEESPGAITILVVSGVSMSKQAQTDIESSKFSVNYWFTIEEILKNATKKLEFYRLLGLTR